MTTVVDLHSSAMLFVDKAEVARAKGDLKAATAYYRKALRREIEAIDLLTKVHPGVEPSWSVMHASAAAIAIKASEYHRAEQLIGVGLAGNATDDVRDELRDLFDEVTYRRHLDLRGVHLTSAEFQFTLAGPAIAPGRASPEVTQRRTENMRRLLERTAERKAHVPFRPDGPVNATVRSALAIQYSEPRAASFALTVSIEQRVGQLPLQLGMKDVVPPRPDDVVSEFLECVRLVEAGKLKDLRERIGDVNYYENFVGLARGMAPDGHDVTTVGFTRGGGPTTETRVAMRRSARHIDVPVRPRRAGEHEITGQLDRFDGHIAKRGPNALVVVVDTARVSHPIHVRKAILGDIVKPRFLETVTVLVKRVGKQDHFVQFLDAGAALPTQLNLN